MSARAMMTMRARVTRNAEAGLDPDNQPLPPNFQVIDDALPCYFWVTSEREVMDTRKIAVVGQMKMIVPKGTDISEKDQVANVVSRANPATVIRPGPLVIENVIPRRDHLELVLEDAA